MLESVLPEPLTASDISVRLGTAWIPPEDITQFVREVLHPPFYAANKITVSYSDAIKSWYVSNKGADSDRNSFAHTKFGTSRANGYELLERALNLRDVQIYDVKIVDGKKVFPQPAGNHQGAREAGRAAAGIQRLDFCRPGAARASGATTTSISTIPARAPITGITSLSPA